MLAVRVSLDVRSSATANARSVGTSQLDAVQSVNAYLQDVAAGTNGSSSGAFAKVRDTGLIWGVTSPGGNLRFMDIEFRPSNSARTSTETRAANLALCPRLHV